MPDTNSKNKLGLIFFLLALLGDIAGIILKNEILQYIFKPLIILALISSFYFATVTIRTNLRNLIISALLFSWLGDVLLMFQDKKDFFFMLGLVAFLIAHIFYIIFFYKVKRAENFKTSFPIVIFVTAYYAGLIIWLSPFLGDMRVPVYIYGIVISTMLMMALHMYPIQFKRAGWLMTAGAIFFVVSDSVLAINKFYQSFEWAGVLIMLTYGLAQSCIVRGAYFYIHKRHNNHIK